MEFKWYCIAVGVVCGIGIFMSGLKDIEKEKTKQLQLQIEAAKFERENAK